MTAWIWNECEPGSVQTVPPSGFSQMGVDRKGHVWLLNNGGNIWSPQITSSAVGTVSNLNTSINTTETLISSPIDLLIPGGGMTGVLWQAGTTIRMTAWGTVINSAAAVLSTFTLRAGASNTVDDASVATWTIASGSTSAGVAIPFYVVLTYTVRTTGNPGTGNGFIKCFNQGVIGISNGNTVSSTATNTGPVTATATCPSLTYKSAAATVSATFQGCITEFNPA